jgi:hypothetical protein
MKTLTIFAALIFLFGACTKETIAPEIQSYEEPVGIEFAADLPILGPPPCLEARCVLQQDSIIDVGNACQSDWVTKKGIQITGDFICEYMDSGDTPIPICWDNVTMTPDLEDKFFQLRELIADIGEEVISELALQNCGSNDTPGIRHFRWEITSGYFQSE